MRILGSNIEFAVLPFSPCWIPVLILLAIILIWILLRLFRRKIVLDKSALLFVAKNETPIKEVLHARFGRHIEILTTLAIIKDLMRDRTENAKKAVWITKEAAIPSFEIKNLIEWARKHSAIIVTADLRRYRDEKVKVYYLTKKFELMEFIREKLPKKAVAPKKVPENELIKFIKHTKRKLR